MELVSRSCCPRDERPDVAPCEETCTAVIAAEGGRAGGRGVCSHAPLAEAFVARGDLRLAGSAGSPVLLRPSGPVHPGAVEEFEIDLPIDSCLARVFPQPRLDRGLSRGAPLGRRGRDA